MPVGGFSQFDLPNLPESWNCYTQSLNEYDVVFTEIDSFFAVYAKMGQVASFGFRKNDGPKWQGSRVAVSHESFVIRAKLPDTILELFADRARNSWAPQSEMSEKQQEIVAQSMREKFDKLASSNLFNEIQKDVDRFGSDAFLK